VAGKELCGGEYKVVSQCVNRQCRRICAAAQRSFTAGEESQRYRWNAGEEVGARRAGRRWSILPPHPSLPVATVIKEKIAREEHVPAYVVVIY